MENKINAERLGLGGTIKFKRRKILLRLLKSCFRGQRPMRAGQPTAAQRKTKMDKAKLDAAFAEQEVALHEWVVAAEAEGHSLYDIARALFTKAAKVQQAAGGDVGAEPQEEATAPNSQEIASSAGTVSPNAAPSDPAQEPTSSAEGNGSAEEAANANGTQA